MNLSREMLDASGAVNSVFEYQADSRLNDRWSILPLTGRAKGDCDDYALTVAWLLSGRSRLRVLRNVINGRARFHFCRTRRGEPHLMLEWRGAYIDNISREWVPAMPHKRGWRAPAPLVAVKMIGTAPVVLACAFRKHCPLSALKGNAMKMTLAIVLAVSPITASAQQNCAPRAAVLAALADKYGETRRAIGLGSGDRLMEVYAAESGSWTILVTTANGITCMVASGQAFEAMPAALEGDPA